MNQQASPLSNSEEPREKKFAKSLQYHNCIYTSCYCEENVWKLCHQIKETDTDLKEYYVVFISNAQKKIPLWMQKQGEDPLTPVIWDYHVILVQKAAHPSVYDLDTLMPFPCPLNLYLTQVIQSEQNLKKEYHRKFRIIEANTFLSIFASDRSHMLKANGQYISPPPDYPPIRTVDEDMNLDEFIDMSSHSYGRVKDLKGFVKFFTQS